METTIAGRKICTPMLNVNTVAAGGGSMLFVRNGLLVVGPEVSDLSLELLFKDFFCFFALVSAVCFFFCFCFS